MPFTGPLEDRILIRELLETYADASTRLDAEAWGGCWAEDALWSLPEYPEIGDHRGRAAIIDAWRSAMQAHTNFVMVNSPGSIEVDGDSARVRTYSTEVFTDADGVTNRTLGTYEDTLSRVDGAWKFTSRTYKNLRLDRCT